MHPEIHQQEPVHPGIRKINIEPENDSLEDAFPFQGCILGFHVNLPGCKRANEVQVFPIT